MIKFKPIFLVGVLVLSQNIVADNNDTATATVNGEVIASLAVAVSNNLILPDLVLPDAGEATTVELTCPSTVVYDGNGGNPFAHGDSAETEVHSSSASKSALASVKHTGTCAGIAVQGEQAYHYVITASTLLMPNAGITLNSINCSSANNFTLGAAFGGSDIVNCGGKITVNDTASVGTYNGSFQVAVVYD